MNNDYQYHIITFGCQMNKSDSERLESVLVNMGMNKTDKPENADVILINTCSVRQASEDRVYGMAANFTKLKKNKPNLIFGVTGCMAGKDKDGSAKKRLGEVDLIFPIEEMINLPRWLCELNPNFLPSENINQNYLALRPNYKKNFQAFVPIQTGCNQYCSYCVVPYARGKETNRPLKEIMEEIIILSENKCLEVTLLGQIINHYQAPDPEHFSKKNTYKKNDFAKLLWEINQVIGIERLYFTAAYPNYMDEEVIDALTLPKQVNFLHLPVQSGSNEILKKMNRHYTAEEYIRIIEKVRNKKPDIAVGTDIIVGFCGETDENFLDTVELYKKCSFDISYNAKYSSRPGTTAAKIFTDNISREEKSYRWEKLQELMEKINLEKNQKYIGNSVSVLVDNFKDGYSFGNSSEMKLVRFKTEKPMTGQIVKVKIHKAQEWILSGEMI